MEIVRVADDAVFVSVDQIRELVRRAEYEVDCGAVAEAILVYVVMLGAAARSEDVLVACKRILRPFEPHA